ncbi:AMP-binding protein [Acidocella aromatica]|uniref:3-methylmercaptopropionyl-CoA ligase n=1 Tax=Acidocella aromatica TaxID=1303579 RepID=A0A840VP39_9PROT|nr:AMP-binding protein [Acidocella aromatica]MBB5373341.1 fatty-acyl-CoA synthase [Acidocella aromatica]
MKESHVRGGNEPPLLEMTIGQALDAAAATWPDNEALVCPAQAVRLTWRGFRDRVEHVAAGLLAQGLEPGDRVGIWSLNRAEWALTQFAAAKAGLILVTVNPAYRLAELEYALNKAGIKALVISPPFKSSDYPGMVAALAPELAECEPGALEAARLPHLRLVVQMGEDILPGAMSFAALENAGREVGNAALAAIAPTLKPHDAINIQFTSGTTGAPKGVTLSHHNILNNGYLVGHGMALTPKDRICIPVPLYHCFGMVMGNLACVTHGSAMVFPGEGFDPLATLQACAYERCTALYGVPTMFIAELDHPRFAEFDFSHMRTGIMAGSPCPIEVMRKVISQMHARDMTICYGMTETSPVSFQTGLDDSLERRVSTVGRVHPHLEVKIVDAEGATVPCGTSGELCTRGYSVMIGYWDDLEQTANAVDAEGWMHTGDLATLDEEGFCQIVGRIKDMVIRGGENLYPREIEEYLYRHPKIQDVQVFGVPDELYGEELCAWVVVREGMVMDDEELRAFCRGQIAHHKIPRYVRFVEDMPKTVTGKIQKFKMRQAMLREMRLIEDAEDTL